MWLKWEGGRRGHGYKRKGEKETVAGRKEGEQKRGEGEKVKRRVGAGVGRRKRGVEENVENRQSKYLDNWGIRKITNYTSLFFISRNTYFCLWKFLCSSGVVGAGRGGLSMEV
jgi:hypothetical protein